MANEIEWDASERLTPEICAENLILLIEAEKASGASAPEPELIARCARLLATHTTEWMYAEEICLGDGQLGSSGLWSIAERGRGQAERAFRWEEGVRLGIHKYVTASVGIADSIAVNAGEPVGIFIKPVHEEDVRKAHCAMRDFRSSCLFPLNAPVRGLSIEKKRQLLFSVEAMPNLLAWDVKRKHGGKERTYWTTPGESNAELASERHGSEWFTKIQYHCFGSIPTDRFEAVLIPSVECFNQTKRFNSSALYVDPLIGDLKRELGRERVLTYEVGKDSDEDFARASFAVGKYLFDRQEPPDGVEEALRYVQRLKTASESERGNADE